MTDTPLHEHPAVLHLMGTEHWPKQGAARLIYDDTRSGARWWWYVDEHNAVDPVGIKTAHSLITLAAVRGMWAKGITVRLTPTAEEHNTIQKREPPVPVPGFFWTTYESENSSRMPRSRHGVAPTETLAILEAYRATVMEKESSK